jgi:DNA-binding helix-turn-helix protein
MKKKYENISEIVTKDLYEEIKAYVNALIDEATKNGSLSDPEADNEYTREIGKLAGICANYENNHMKFEYIKVKSPLILEIEKEMEKRAIKQRQAANLLDVKESTFSQIMTGKRPISMRMAKRLYQLFKIDPKLLIEHA